jgi:hypothetical protein
MEDPAHERQLLVPRGGADGAREVALQRLVRRRQDAVLVRRVAVVLRHVVHGGESAQPERAGAAGPAGATRPAGLALLLSRAQKQRHRLRGSRLAFLDLDGRGIGAAAEDVECGVSSGVKRAV